jgi:uncharacterized protein
MSQPRGDRRLGDMDTNSNHTSDAEHVREVISRIFRAVEEVDADAYFDRTYHDDVVIHEAPSLPYGGDYHGLEGAADHAQAFMAAWAPFRRPSDQAMNYVIDAVPDHAYVRWTLQVAGRSFPFLSHYGFRDGLIVESRMFPFDAAGVAAWWTELDREAGS